MLLFTSGAPVLLIAGAAVLGGALYGTSVGGRNFHWGEAIVGAVISGAGVFATDVVGGGIASLASYLMRTPDWSWQGAVGAFSLGAGLSATFAGFGAVLSKAAAVLGPYTSRFWPWFGRTPRGEQTSPRAMLAAAFDVPPGLGGVHWSVWAASQPPPQLGKTLQWCLPESNAPLASPQEGMLPVGLRTTTERRECGRCEVHAYLDPEDLEAARRGRTRAFKGRGKKACKYVL